MILNLRCQLSLPLTLLKVSSDGTNDLQISSTKYSSIEDMSDEEGVAKLDL